MKLKQRCIASILTLGLIISGIFVSDAYNLTTISSSGIEFSDISGHWSESQIRSFLENGYINGYEDGTFRPDNSITRAEFVRIVNNYFGLTTKSEKVFNDTMNHWAKDEIDIAVTNGVCQGTSATTFDPDDLITREQAAKMIANYRQLKSWGDDVVYFTDYNEMSSWAIDSIDAVVCAGHMNSADESQYFRPKDPITRAETVTLLGRVHRNNFKPDLDSKFKNIVEELEKGGWHIKQSYPYKGYFTSPSEKITILCRATHQNTAPQRALLLGVDIDTEQGETFETCIDELKEVFDLIYEDESDQALDLFINNPVYSQRIEAEFNGILGSFLRTNLFIIEDPIRQLETFSLEILYK